MSNIIKAVGRVQSPTLTGLRVTGSVIGKPIPVIYGTTRMTPLLIWAGNFKQTSDGKGKKSNARYAIDVDYLTGYGPQEFIGGIWADKNFQSPVGASQFFNTGSTPGTSFSFTVNNVPPSQAFEMITSVAAALPQSATFYDYGATGPTGGGSVPIGASWAANTYYSNAGNVIIDSNGNLQQVTTGGLSGGSTPSWATSVGLTTTDGTVTWTMLQTAASLTRVGHTQYAFGSFIVVGGNLYQLIKGPGVTIDGNVTLGHLNGTNKGQFNYNYQAIPVANYSVQSLLYNDVRTTGSTDANVHPMQVATINGAGEVTGFTTPDSNTGENWSWAIYGELIIPYAGNYQFTFNHDDGIMWGILGGQRLSGDYQLQGMNPFTAVQNIPVIGGLNISGNHQDREYIVYFPTAGTFQFEIDYTNWEHAQTMVLKCQPVGVGPLGGYDIVQAGHDMTQSSAPSFPSFSTANKPAYASAIESAGQYQWNCLGPVGDFVWHANTNFTTVQFIVDGNGNWEYPFRSGVSDASTQPTWATALNDLTNDDPNLIWINRGPGGSPPGQGGGSGAISGTFVALHNQAFPAPNQGDWQFALQPYAVYNTSPGSKVVTVHFPSPVTSVNILVQYNYAGGPSGTGAIQLPLTNYNMSFETRLGSAGGNPVAYDEFSGAHGTQVDMGAANVLPSFSFEVKGLYGYVGRGDCNYADILLDLITSGTLLGSWTTSGGTPPIWNHGMNCSGYTFTPPLGYNFNPTYSRFGSMLADESNIWKIGVPGRGTNVGLNNLRSYCDAYGIFGSYSMADQNDASQIIDDLMVITNSAAVWDGAELDFVPYCEVSALGNGSIFNAPTAKGPIGVFLDGDYTTDPGKSPLAVQRTRPENNYNSLSLEYTDRNNMYNVNHVLVGDVIDITQQGQMPGTQAQYPWIHDPTVATGVAWVTMRRQLTINRVSYKWRANPAWCLLKPMAFVAVVDPAMAGRAPVIDPGLLASPNGVVPIISTGLTSVQSGTNSVVVSGADTETLSALQPGDTVEITGPGLSIYLGQHPVTAVDADAGTFTFDAGFSGTTTATVDVDFPLLKIYPIFCCMFMQEHTVQLTGVTVGGYNTLFTVRDYYYGDHIVVGMTDTSQFGLGPSGGGTITDLAIPSTGIIPCRITKITENPYDQTNGYALDIEAEPFIYGVSAPTTPSYTNIPSGGGVPVDTQTPPGDVNAPVIFETVPRLSNNPQIWLGLSGGNQYYGGCDIWLSTDGGTTYNVIGRFPGSSTQGVTIGDYPPHADPDTANTLGVDLTLSATSLPSYTTGQRDAFQSLAYLNGGGTLVIGGVTLTIPYELVAYATANLVASEQYSLPPTIRRGCLQTPVADHPDATDFLLLADNNVFKLDLNPNWIGLTLHFKFTAFNVWGNAEEDVADVADYTFTPTGQTGWNAIGYTISPQPAVFQGKPGGWPVGTGGDANANTWTDPTKVYLPAITATLGSKSASYAARDSGIVAFSNSAGGETVYVSIFDPTFGGEPTGTPTLTVYADLSPSTHYNQSGYVQVGIITSQPFSGGGGSGGGTTTMANDLYCFGEGAFAASEVFWAALPTRQVTLDAGLPGTLIQCDVAPTANATLTIYKIVAGVSTSIGTITILAGQTTGTASFLSQVILNGTGDAISVQAPATPDATLAGVRITFKASRSN